MSKAKDWIEKGKLFHERGQYDQAIDSFKRALSIKPDNTDAMIRIGLSYRYKEEYDKAIKWYEKVLEIDPKSKLALNNIGYALECKGELDEAAKRYTKALEIDPVYELALINLIKILNDKKEYHKIIEVLEKALELDPVNPGNWIDIGLAFNDIGEYEKAIDAYEKALKFEPSKIAYNNLGWTYFNKNEYEKATKLFAESLKIDWKYDIPYGNLNKIYNYLVDNQIKDCTLWKSLAEAYYIAREYKFALDSCNRCLGINDKFKNIRKLKEKILEAKRKVDMKSNLNNIIDIALNTFSMIATSVLLKDVVGYIKYKEPELEFTFSEIKYAIIDFINKRGLNIRLDDNRLIILKEDRHTLEKKLTI
ncbi:MAG: tetratricopeptide repeat protein [Promethearchaeota archaeon]